MPDRRTFMQQVVGGGAAIAVSGLNPGGRVLGANDRVRFGLIGAGGRGQAIFKAAIKVPNTQAVAVADVYTRRLDQAKAIAPGVKTYSDFRRLLDDKSVDAVLIATPQHQHALNFVPAIQAGKDVYQEKTMAFTPDHARRMRKAFESSNRVVQIGIQSLSGIGYTRVRRLATPERMGAITALHTHAFRNAPYGGWKREIPDDCDTAHVDWKAFEGEAEPRPFDPNRYMNWRFYWDYSGGNVYENFVHQVGFWHKVLGLDIPPSVTMAGNNYLNPAMELPDTMDVSMDYEKKLLFTWNSMFGNRHYGEQFDLLLGTKGTILRDEDENIRYVPEGRSYAPESMQAGAGKGSAPDIVDAGDATQDHMQNFFDCVRSRKEPNAPFEIGYKSAIACQMCNMSYRLKRTVRWDPQLMDIV
ncbi:MAG TPA: Gfo/Idh/MocA family oxidoreductase [Terriglobia bacterium]|nr:Gfo/Idh/MocA family oxidoreductase [Terriglobia bacterium]